MRTLILHEPKRSFTAQEVATTFGIEVPAAERYLEYLADLHRECEVDPKYRGTAKVLLRGQPYYEALSDNPDVRRDYDYRATNEGGRSGFRRPTSPCPTRS